MFELGAMVHSKGSGSDNPHSWPCRSMPQMLPGITTPVLKMYLIVGCWKNDIINSNFSQQDICYETFLDF